MLILTRRIGETLHIGDEITVTVLGTKGGQIRIGIDAPAEVAVHREEVYERIRQEQSHNDVNGNTILTPKRPTLTRSKKDEQTSFSSPIT